MPTSDKDYILQDENGAASPRDLFEGRRQLRPYHLRFGPNRSERCDGCPIFLDQVGHLAHLHAFTTDGAGPIPCINVELVGREQIRAGIEHAPKALRTWGGRRGGPT